LLVGWFLEHGGTGESRFHLFIVNRKFFASASTARHIQPMAIHHHPPGFLNHVQVAGSREIFGDAPDTPEVRAPLPTPKA
jgi:hypothetical protein